jgi:adenylate cyclase
MPLSRQLVAIMFTDIVGYTSLMGEDEEKAFDLLNKNRQIQQPLIEQYGGKWIKELGDGVLASFATVTDAVMCAGTIQQSSLKIPGLKLRIGIHLGDVVFENNDVFGDGVNIASRLLAHAAAGGICASESVYNNVANKKGISAIFLREEILKNVKDPVKIYEVTVEKMERALSTHPANSDKPFKKTPGKSIAVLPFVNMSNDPDQEYFSDGMAEEILNSLAHVKDLKVAGRTSSFQFKGKNSDLREVGEKLNVRTVLEGSVRKQGNRLRITAQLINVEDGYHLWSERYDREMDDIFAIQDEIALAITEKLKITLLDNEKAIIHKNPTENHDAYDLYLKGRFYLNKRGPDLKKALAHFQQAAAMDPDFALAFAGMADAYTILAFYSIMPPHEAMPKAKEYAEKSIGLNAACVEAYTTLAFISVFYDWTWAKAKKQFQQVFELNPNYAPAHYWYSYYLSFVERKSEESVREAKYAAEHLEPLVAFSHHVLAMMLVNARRFEEGVLESKMAIELDADYSPGFRGLGLNLAGLKKFDDSIEALKIAVQLSARHPWYLVELGWVYSLSGNQSEAQQILDELLIRSKTEFISGLFMSGAAYFSKNYDQAYEFMEVAFDQRDGALPCMKTWPLCNYIREDARFQPFLQRMNFPE